MVIDDTTSHLVCIQFRLNERVALVAQLDSLIHNGEPFDVRAEGNGYVRFETADHGIQVDARSPRHIVIRMDAAGAIDLRDSIQEHITDRIEWHLDHALEPLGASLQPLELEDVVIETIPD